MGAAFEEIVSTKLLTAGQVEKQLAIEKGSYHNGITAITVVVDGGRSHKHSYNANSGVGVIFGAATKALLFIGVRNKYYSICAINNRNEKPIPTHQCYRNVSGSSTSMEADIILEGFANPRRCMASGIFGSLGMEIRSSVYHSVVTGVPSYG